MVSFLVLTIVGFGGRRLIEKFRFYQLFFLPIRRKDNCPFSLIFFSGSPRMVDNLTNLISFTVLHKSIVFFPSGFRVKQVFLCRFSRVRIENYQYVKQLTHQRRSD